ncbi:MAG TPA: hypothetical protein VJJ46_10015 [Anaerolineales bacterium]|nr:hypothetical protein [Anaerolineales bacterium]
MSTIIGFAGGGIGFLLQENINLLNYRGASAQCWPSRSSWPPWTT